MLGQRCLDRVLFTCVIPLCISGTTCTACEGFGSWVPSFSAVLDSGFIFSVTGMQVCQLDHRKETENG